MGKKIRVVELFAGVGGFRIGLEGWEGKSSSSGYTKKINSSYEIIWGNQYEPSSKTQHAYNVYSARFTGKHSNKEIASVIEQEFDEIKDHDLLVGGFPCQDYSVARTLNQAAGLKGKKGVLWWSIHEILEKKIKNGSPVPYLMLENVDRLLKSPANQRGRDFAIMLSSLSRLGYAVEWRVINAAEYGMPQRRRRVFFIGYYKGTPSYEKLSNSLKENGDWLLKSGVIAKAFPVEKKDKQFITVGPEKLSSSLIELTEMFNNKGEQSPFRNSGMMIGHKYWTLDTKPKFKGEEMTLRKVIITANMKTVKDYIEKNLKYLIKMNIKDLSERNLRELIAEYLKDFIVDENDSKVKKKWDDQKGSKKTIRISKEGFEYEYAEGSMVFPDSMDKPSRTIVTGEGGSSASRFKHVIRDPVLGKLRRLIPIELERLNMFPDNHTKFDGISDVKRAFFMGNALVVGIIEKLGKELAKRIKE